MSIKYCGFLATIFTIIMEKNSHFANKEVRRSSQLLNGIFYINYKRITVNYNGRKYVVYSGNLKLSNLLLILNLKT